MAVDFPGGGDLQIAIALEGFAELLRGFRPVEVRRAATWTWTSPRRPAGGRFAAFDAIAARIPRWLERTDLVLGGLYLTLKCPDRLDMRGGWRDAATRPRTAFIAGAREDLRGDMPEIHELTPDVRGWTPDVQGCAPLSLSVQPAIASSGGKLDRAPTRTVDVRGGSGTRSASPTSLAASQRSGRGGRRAANRDGPSLAPICPPGQAGPT
jgi:hypothetical protein